MPALAQSNVRSLKEISDLFLVDGKNSLTLEQAKYIQLKEGIPLRDGPDGKAGYSPQDFAKAWSKTTPEEMDLVAKAPRYSAEEVKQKFGLEGTKLESVVHRAGLHEVNPGQEGTPAAKMEFSKALIERSLARIAHDQVERPRAQDLYNWKEERALLTVPYKDAKLLEKPRVEAQQMGRNYTVTMTVEANGKVNQISMKANPVEAEKLMRAEKGETLKSLSFQMMGARHVDDPNRKQDIAVLKSVERQPELVRQQEQEHQRRQGRSVSPDPVITHSGRAVDPSKFARDSEAELAGYRAQIGRAGRSSGGEMDPYTKRDLETIQARLNQGAGVKEAGVRDIAREGVQNQVARGEAQADHSQDRAMSRGRSDPGIGD